MGVHGRPAEHLVDPFDEPLRYDMLELLGVVVHLVPSESHYSDEEELDQPVTPEDQGGELFARGR